MAKAHGIHYSWCQVCEDAFIDSMNFKAHYLDSPPSKTRIYFSQSLQLFMLMLLLHVICRQCLLLHTFVRTSESEYFNRMSLDICLQVSMRSNLSNFLSETSGVCLPSWYPARPRKCFWNRSIFRCPRQRLSGWYFWEEEITALFLGGPFLLHHHEFQGRHESHFPVCCQKI